jgi:hypothetical protein
MKEFAASLLEFAELAMEKGKIEEAIAILGEARALQPEKNIIDRINMLAGEARYDA